MKVHIANDYDYDCEVVPEGSGSICHDKKVYEVPDHIVKEYEEVNERRRQLQDIILLIKRQGPL